MIAIDYASLTVTLQIPNIQGKKVATIVCGGNIDVNAIAQVIECGLMVTGRRIRLALDISDRPGSLNVLIGHISTHQANV